MWLCFPACLWVWYFSLQGKGEVGQWEAGWGEPECWDGASVTNRLPRRVCQRTRLECPLRELRARQPHEAPLQEGTRSLPQCSSAVRAASRCRTPVGPRSGAPAQGPRLCSVPGMGGSRLAGSEARTSPPSRPEHLPAESLNTAVFTEEAGGGCAEADGFEGTCFSPPSGRPLSPLCRWPWQGGSTDRGHWTCCPQPEPTAVLGGGGPSGPG